MDTESHQDEVTPEEARIASLSRHFRHIGYAFFGGLALVTAIFLAYCIITAINGHQVIDPLTGAPVSKY